MILVVRSTVRVNTMISNAKANIHEMTRTTKGHLLRASHSELNVKDIPFTLVIEEVCQPQADP